MFWTVKSYQPISLLSSLFCFFHCISHLLCGGHNLFICTHQTGKSSGQRHDSVPPEARAVAVCLRTAASPLSLRRAAAMRKCQRKLKTEVRARALSQSKELERETGTGAWWFKMTNHAEPRSACFHCGVTPRPLASRPRGHGSHVEAKSVPMRANEMHFLSTYTALCWGQHVFKMPVDGCLFVF